VKALALLALGGCSVLLPASGPPTTAPVFAVMDQFGCLGAWPAYELTVYTNGVVEYHGLGYVRVIGKRTTDIGPEGVELLRRRFERVGFMSLQDDYTARIDDECGLFILRYGGKQVIFGGERSEAAPDGLLDLTFEFERLSNSKQWTDWTD
jgi:hypothetical protein